MVYYKICIRSFRQVVGVRAAVSVSWEDIDIMEAKLGKQ